MTARELVISVTRAAHDSSKAGSFPNDRCSTCTRVARLRFGESQRVEAPSDVKVATHFTLPFADGTQTMPKTTKCQGLRDLEVSECPLRPLMINQQMGEPLSRLTNPFVGHGRATNLQQLGLGIDRSAVRPNGQVRHSPEDRYSTDRRHFAALHPKQRAAPNASGIGGHGQGV